MKKRCNVAIVILAATAIVTVALERDAPRETDRQGHSFAKRIPLEIGQWEAEELPVAPAVVEMLDTDDVLMRSYKNGKDQQIVFAAVFAMDNRRAAHPPEICYQGAGWSVEGKSDVHYTVQPPADGYIPPANENGQATPGELRPLTSLGDPINFTFTELIIRHPDGRHQVVHYWYKTGGKTTNSQIWHEYHMFLNNILYRGSSNSLLRVSASARTLSAEHIQAARAAVEDFSKAVYPYTLAAMP